MKKIGVASAMLAVMLLSACTSDPPDFASDPPPSDAPASSSPSDDPSPIPSPTPTLVKPRSGLVDVRARGWDEAKVIDQRTLEISFYDGIEECYGVAAVDVDETADRVTITLKTGRVPGDRACIEVAVLKAVRVTLRADIGDREVVDSGEKAE